MLFKKIVCVYIIALYSRTNSVASKSLEGRIVGGETADIKDHPYIVQFNIFNEPKCAASIISRYYAISAAHCVFPERKIRYTIRAGTSYLGKGGVVKFIKRIYVHPEFRKGSAQENDIAVLELKTPLTFSKKIKPILLPKPGLIDVPGMLGNISGWGTTVEDGFQSTVLKTTSVPIVNFRQCNRLFGDVLTKNMICAGFKEGGKDACQGDSGGPFVINGVLVGIVSFGAGCAEPNTPGIYTKVSNYVNFIKSKVKR